MCILINGREERHKLAGLMGPTPLKYHMRDSGETEMERERAAAKGRAEGRLLRCGWNDGVAMIGRGKRERKGKESGGKESCPRESRG